MKSLLLFLAIIAVLFIFCMYVVLSNPKSHWEPPQDSKQQDTDYIDEDGQQDWICPSLEQCKG